MAAKKESAKKEAKTTKSKKYKITKGNGNIIFRYNLDQGQIAHHKKIGSKVEEN